MGIDFYPNFSKFLLRKISKQNHSVLHWYFFYWETGFNITQLILVWPTPAPGFFRNCQSKACLDLNCIAPQLSNTIWSDALSERALFYLLGLGSGLLLCVVFVLDVICCCCCWRRRRRREARNIQFLITFSKSTNNNSYLQTWIVCECKLWRKGRWSRRWHKTWVPVRSVNLQILETNIWYIYKGIHPNHIQR